MATPGSWIGKTPAASTSTKQETDSLETKKSEETMSSVIERLETRLGIRESKPTEQTARRATSKEGSATTRPSRPKKTRSSSRSNGNSPEAKVVPPKHAIHQNVDTGIFWCDCEGFKSHLEVDVKYHLKQYEPKKKPFVRKEHLTDRPFQDNEALQALRDSLPEAEKFNPGKKPRNKENN